MNDQSWEIAGRTLEYIDDCHLYLVDGVIVPSVTQLISDPNKYKDVPPSVLEKARLKGVAVHEAIERFVKEGVRDPMIADFPELIEDKCLNPIGAEIPVILFRKEEPFAAGRLDLLLAGDDGCVIADVKTTAKLDIPYITLQLNYYRIGFEQSYGMEITGLAAIHLRENAKYQKINLEDIRL